jgi:hypothetical protein
MFPGVGTFRSYGAHEILEADIYKHRVPSGLPNNVNSRSSFEPMPLFLSCLLEGTSPTRRSPKS